MSANISEKRISISVIVMIVVAVLMVGMQGIIRIRALGEAAFALFFIMLYIVNPIFAAVIGVVAGLNIKKYCFFALIPSIVFSLCMGIIWHLKIAEWVIVSLYYLGIALIIMGITFLIKLIKNRITKSKAAV